MTTDIDTSAQSREIVTLRAALEWYATEAEAIARNMQAKPPRPDACMASLAVLSLDAGKRARAAMKGAA